MFIDQVQICVKGGRGGNGCVSFRREKFVPRGGPDGGDGGKGGSVILEGDEGLNTLSHIINKNRYKAAQGKGGQGSNKHGKSGEDLLIKIPVGTVVYLLEGRKLLCDMDEKNRRFVAAKGGAGGRGNARFATAENRAPRFAENGEDGEERWLTLELKLLADVGIIGLPNSGKSTLISKISSAKPKIANYPFTTLVPNLGVVELENYKTFVVADVPGLVEGAHKGSGLGIRFLKHIERTSVLVHLIDVSEGSREEPTTAYRTLTTELERFNPEILKKSKIIVANKIDLPHREESIAALREIAEKGGFEFAAVSAVTGMNLKALVGKTARMLGLRED